MSTDDSDQVKDFFIANSCDLTPAPVRHLTRLLYMPVSTDQELTRRCASMLSDTEFERADRLAIEGDRILFKQRRAFRRFCGALALGSSQHLSQIDFDQTKNGRPHLPGSPDICFSFSSCRYGFLGAWSATHAIGVDLEDQTRTLEPVELAQRYFTTAEAETVNRPGGAASLRTFFRLWSLKEAALKSIGEGIPFGLDRFEFELEPELRVVSAPDDLALVSNGGEKCGGGGRTQFDPHLVEVADGCVALVIRSLA